MWLGRIADALVKLDNQDGALQNYNEAIKIAEEINDNKLLSSLYARISRNYIMKTHQNIFKAITTMKNSMKRH